jgi:hypothetical protein
MSDDQTAVLAEIRDALRGQLAEYKRVSSEMADRQKTIISQQWKMIRLYKLLLLVVGIMICTTAFFFWYYYGGR